MIKLCKFCKLIKKLIILCIGGAEQKCVKDYGNLPGKAQCAEKKEFIDFFKSKQIEYISAIVFYLWSVVHLF